MKIGCPTEIKTQEYRVGLRPIAVKALTDTGHTVVVQTGAGEGSGYPDAEYVAAGATILPDAAAVFAEAEMIVKVKEPQASERAMLRKGQILFTYLHLAPDAAQTRALLDSGVTAIAYETVTDRSGALPLLAPMSEVAGKLAPQMGAWALERPHGGRGVLMGGIAGVEPARVAVIGGGVVGTQAARVAAGMGADVTVLDVSIPRLRQLDDLFRGEFASRYAAPAALDEVIAQADLVIGAVLIPGAEAPKLIRRTHLAMMKPGSVIVDVAIDQGGCAETARPTTHDDPVFTVEGIQHYCVANMPGAVPRSATQGLGNATLPYIRMLADKGWRAACQADAGLAAGLSVHEGLLTCPAVGAAQGLAVTPLAEVL